MIVFHYIVKMLNRYGLSIVFCLLDSCSFISVVMFYSVFSKTYSIKSVVVVIHMR